MNRVTLQSNDNAAEGVLYMVLSVELSHRQLTAVFCDAMTEISHIVRSGETVLDDGRMWVGG